jgi:4-aminobutyrate--pyruvate transaminase
LLLRRIASGSGIRVTDAGGTEYIEAMSGLWCCGLGWGNEELVAASAEQMKTLSFYHGFTGRQTDASEALADALMAKAPARLRGGKVFFGQSGSDANDTQARPRLRAAAPGSDAASAQVRLLWLKAHLEGREGKKKFISRNRGYHGVTVASGSLTGLPYVHKSAGLPLDSVLAAHVTCPSFYREGRPGETEAAFVQRLAAELERAIVDAGPDTVAAFIAEPMQGAGGVVVPPPGYHEATRQICDEYDVAIVGDEVEKNCGGALSTPKARRSSRALGARARSGALKSLDRSRT